MKYGIKTLASLLFFTSLGLSTNYAIAVEDAIVPPPPPRVQSGEVIEPEVNIIENSKERIEQYSVNGQVYAVKITPKSGPAYYLIDSDGDGNLETRSNDIERGMEVPQWILFSWN